MKFTARFPEQRLLKRSGNQDDQGFRKSAQTQKSEKRRVERIGQAGHVR